MKERRYYLNQPVTHDYGNSLGELLHLPKAENVSYAEASVGADIFCASVMVSGFAKTETSSPVGTFPHLARISSGIVIRAVPSRLIVSAASRHTFFAACRAVRCCSFQSPGRLGTGRRDINRWVSNNLFPTCLPKR